MEVSCSSQKNLYTSPLSADEAFEGTGGGSSSEKNRDLKMIIDHQRCAARSGGPGNVRIHFWETYMVVKGSFGHFEKAV